MRRAPVLRPERGLIPCTGTVSFHNFKSQNFKLSVSNPKSKYVAYLSVLSQISDCQSLGRKNKQVFLFLTDRNSVYGYVGKSLFGSVVIPVFTTTHTHTHTHTMSIYLSIYVYIYIYIERERERYYNTHTHTCTYHITCIYIYIYIYIHTIKIDRSLAREV